MIPDAIAPDAIAIASTADFIFIEYLLAGW
jgi:hypothetical protein